jgi:hypothetical protein
MKRPLPKTREKMRTKEMLDLPEFLEKDLFSGAQPRERLMISLQTQLTPFLRLSL